MNDFDTRVANIGRQRAIAFFAPRLAVLAVLGVVLAVLLAGCGPTTGDKPKAKAEQFLLDPVLYRDQVTGCQYLSTSDRYTLTPRIAADGKTHMGCKAVAP